MNAIWFVGMYEYLELLSGMVMIYNIDKSAETDAYMLFYLKRRMKETAIK